MSPNNDINEAGKINYTGPVPAHKPKHEHVPTQDQPTQIILTQPDLGTNTNPYNNDTGSVNRVIKKNSGNIKNKIHNTSKDAYDANIHEKDHSMHKLQNSQSHFRRKSYISNLDVNNDNTTQLPNLYAKQVENDSTKSGAKPKENLTDYIKSMLKNLETYHTIEEEDDDNTDIESLDAEVYNKVSINSTNINNRNNIEENETISIDDPSVSEYKTSLWERLRKKRPISNSQKLEDDRSAPNQTTQSNYNIDIDLDETFPEKDYEYKNASEVKEKLKYIGSRKFVLVIQSMFLSILLIFSLFVTYSAYSVTPIIWDSISPNSNPLMFYSINFLIIFLAVCVNGNMIFNGLKDFFAFKATGDSMVSILSIVSLLFSLFLISDPDLILKSGIHYYNSIAIFSLLMNSVGKLLIVQKTKDNFALLTSIKKWKSAEIVTDEGLRDEVDRIIGDTDSLTAISVRTGFLRRFLELSISPDNADKNDKIIAPVCFFSSFMLAVGSYIVYKNIPESISLFIACLSICSPFTTLLCSNLPIYSSAKKLRKYDTILSGNDTVYDFSQTTSVVVDATNLFPKGSVSLQALKTFEGGRIDEAIIDAASIVYSLSSTLSSMFMGIIEERTKILNQVDTIVYEDEMGISAWVGGKRVLLGNRELMINHDIEVPSEEYENKYKTDGKELVYLSTSGVLSAMYVVKYHNDKKITELLRKLAKQNVTIIVRTTDPNITADKLSRIFGIDTHNFRVVPDRGSDRYKYVTKARTKVDAKLSYAKGTVGFLSGILESIRLGSTISTLSILQIIGMIVGYVAIAMCTFFSGVDLLTPLRIFSYNLLWLGVIAITSKVRK